VKEHRPGRQRLGSVSGYRAPLDRQSRDGRDDTRPQGRRRGSRLDAHADYIIGMIEERKDITLNEMVERLLAERSMRIGPSTLSDWL
jgi:transposase